MSDMPDMDESLLAKAMSEMGRRGGKKRAENLTAEQRRQSAIKASRAAAEARTLKAKEKRAQGRKPGE